jgi:hypothetical protein
MVAGCASRSSDDGLPDGTLPDRSKRTVEVQTEFQTALEEGSRGKRRVLAQF